ncbi:uncharacterized protein LOC142632463 [Castanea sativa]|uniref:uncharacterized protein LOC142632463 n=1 Tax=Castanea sativa TaxID=21020 RepID=UPI003F64A7DD
MALWAIELSEFDIKYRPRTTIKGQVVADFIVEFTNAKGQGIEYPQWNVFTDGSSNKGAGGAGVVFQSPEGDKVECMVRLDFPTTNNEAAYEALIAGLDLAKVVGATNILIHCNSQVVTNQVNGDYKCKGERMKKYLEQAKRRVNELQAKVVQIPRGENEQADYLAKAASAEYMTTPDKVLSFIQLSPLIDVVNIQEIGSEKNWTTPLISYLKDGTLPKGEEAARKLKVQSVRFVLIKDVLYKRGFSRPYLRCLGLEEAEYIMREVHEGICGNHSGSRSLVHKLIRTGYYWPTMQNNTQVYVKALRQLKFLVVGIDYFTKWVEAEALAMITEKNVRSFVWKSIICRYGIPRVLVSDNVEIGLMSYRVDNHDEGRNDEELRLQLDLTDEVRAIAEQRLARYQDLMAKHYNS